MGLVCYSVCWDVFITVPFSAWGWRRVMRWMKRSLVLDERAVRTVITGGGNNSQPEHPSVWLTLLVVKLLYYNNNNNNKVSTVVFSQGSAVMILIFWSRRTCPSGNHFLFFLFLTRGENIHKKSGVLWELCPVLSCNWYEREDGGCFLLSAPGSPGSSVWGGLQGSSLRLLH